MISQKDYWNKKISEWSSASYGKRSKISLIEKIATHFRAVDKRKNAALKLIGPFAKEKIVLDLGCGIGGFTFGLLKYRPKKVIGIDISPVAAREVKDMAKKLDDNGRVEFRVADVSKLDKLPEFDIAVGLGFIDYLKPHQLKHLFKLIKDKLFLFSYFEKKLSLFNLLHKIYTALQNCPGAYKYTRDEIREFIPKKTKLYFINQDELWFISNLKLKK